MNDLTVAAIKNWRSTISAIIVAASGLCTLLASTLH